MIKSYDYYRKLITSEYRHAPKFTAMVKALVNYGVDIDSAVDKMLLAFEIDNASTNQLDILGDIVGVDRNLKFTPSPVAMGSIVCPNPEEMESGEEYPVYNTPLPPQMPNVKFLSGLAPEYMNEDGQLIDDDTFRIMIKARIIQNFWKGTLPELYELWNAVFGKEKILHIQDLQNMSYNVVLQGDISPLEEELVANGYIVPKPEGVRINIITFVSSEGLPLFSYNYDTMTYSGYGSHWVEEATNG